METRQFRRMTPATRFRSVSDFSEITKTEPEKTLLEPLRRTGGRNNKGHITSRYMSGGHKRQYPRNDFPRDKIADSARGGAVANEPQPTARIPPRPIPRGGKTRHPAAQRPQGRASAAARPGTA